MGKVLTLAKRCDFQLAGISLLVLAIFDTVLTDAGIRHHYISEANPLMRLVYNSNIFYFYMIKLSLPFLLLFLLRKVKPKPIFHLLLGTALLLYMFVFVQHLIWMFIVLTTAV